MAEGKDEAGYRWWCLSCEQFTEKAPCEHCAAGHEEVLVIQPGQTPPRKEAEADEWPTVNDFEWPQEVYASV